MISESMYSEGDIRPIPGPCRQALVQFLCSAFAAEGELRRLVSYHDVLNSIEPKVSWANSRVEVANQVVTLLEGRRQIEALLDILADERQRRIGEVDQIRELLVSLETSEQPLYAPTERTVPADVEVSNVGRRQAPRPDTLHHSRRFREFLLVLAGVLLIVLGLLTGLAAFVPRLSQILASWTSVIGFEARWLVLAIGALSAFTGTVLFSIGRRVKSRLAQGASLNLDPGDPQHLVGREDATREICSFCREQPLTFLEGETGAGKSAVMRSGVCLELSKDTSVLPLYVDIAARDWVEGAKKSVLDALGKAAKSDQIRRLCADGQVSEIDSGKAVTWDTESLEPLLTRCSTRLRRQPILIFDQFDDYQTRHRDKFFSEGRSTWLTTGELTQLNPFWDLVRSLLSNRKIHCVIVTRTDMAGGLASVRFVAEPEPFTYRLKRLPKTAIQAMIERLAKAANGAPPVIIDPDCGWDQLRDAIERDVEDQGTVLPIRLVSAMQGLPHLPWLTVREYAKAGGLVGLERRHVAYHVMEAARLTGAKKEIVLRLLVEMVDRGGGGEAGRADAVELKTRPLTSTEVRTKWSDWKGASATLPAVIDYLRQERLVRARIDADTGNAIYALRHDSVCHGVLEADRMADRYQREAADAYEQFRRATGSLWKRWSSLLTPWQQVRLLGARLRGRFSYVGLRQFAGLSLIRLAPMILLIATLLTGASIARNSWERAETDRVALELLTTIEPSKPFGESEAAAFETLATSSDAVRLSFLRQALSRDYCTELRSRRSLCLRAAIGLSLERRNRVIEEILIPVLTSDVGDYRVSVAALECADQLRWDGTERVSAVVAFWTGDVLSVARREDPDDWAPMVTALQSVSGSLTRIQANGILSNLTSVVGLLGPSQLEQNIPVFQFQRDSDEETRQQLAEAFLAVFSRIAPEDSLLAVRQGISVDNVLRERGTKSAILTSMRRLIQLLPTDCRDAAREEIVTTVLRSSNYSREADILLADLISEIPGPVTQKQAKEISTSFMKALPESRGLRLRELTAGLLWISSQTTGDDAFALLQPILDAVPQTTGATASNLLKTLDYIISQMAPDQARAARRSLVNAALKPAARDTTEGMARSLATLLDRCPGEDCDEALAQIIATMPAVAQPLPLSRDKPLTPEGSVLIARSDGGAAPVLVAVARRFPAERSEKAYERILAAMEVPDTTNRLALCSALADVSVAWSPEQAAYVVTELLRWIAEADGIDKLDFGNRLAAIVGRFRGKTSAKTCYKLLDAIRSTAKRDDQVALSLAVRAVASQLDADSLEEARSQLVDAIAAVPDHTRPSLCEALVEIPGPFDVEHGLVLLPKILNTMCVANEGEANVLERMLSLISAALRDQYVGEVQEQIVATMTRTQQAEILKRLALALRRFPEPLSDSQVSRAMRALADCNLDLGQERSRLLLAEMNHAIASRMTETQSAAELSKVVSLVSKAELAAAPLNLAVELEAIASLQKGQYGKAALVEMISVLALTRNPTGVFIIVNGILAVPERLTAEQATAVYGDVLKALEISDNSDLDLRLAQQLSELKGGWVTGEADGMFVKVADVSSRKGDSRTVKRLAEALILLGPELSASGRERAFSNLIKQIGVSKNSEEDVDSFTFALKSVMGSLTPQQSRLAFKAVVGDVLGDSTRLFDRANALRYIRSVATVEESESTLASIVKKMQETDKASQLLSLSLCVRALGDEGGSDEPIKALRRLVAVISTTTDVLALSTLVEAITAVPAKLTTQQAEEVFEPILRGMERPLPGDRPLFMPQLLGRVPSSLRVTLAYDLLDHPVAGGVLSDPHLRDSFIPVSAGEYIVLKIIERDAGVEFSGDVWKFVEWARAEHGIRERTKPVATGGKRPVLIEVRQL